MYQTNLSFKRIPTEFAQDDLRGERYRGGAWQRASEPYPGAGARAEPSFCGENCAVSQGQVVVSAVAGIWQEASLRFAPGPELKKRYWGSHLWSRGYFCCTIGAVTEEMIKRYIEDQDDTPDGFKVWDEEKQAETTSVAPAFRPIAKPSSLDEGR